MANAKQWKQAQLIREYISVAQNLDAEYLIWANQKADWLDPLTVFEDDWLIPSDKNTF